MPFKTRKEKEAAVARRFEVSKKQLTFGYRGVFSGEGKVEKGKDMKVKEVALAIDDFSYLARDLVKILLLASGLILLQVVLSLTLV